MAVVAESSAREDGAAPGARRSSFVRRMRNQTQLILMSVPIVAYVILFSYYPIWGWTMAFQQYRPHEQCHPNSIPESPYTPDTQTS